MTEIILTPAFAQFPVTFSWLYEGFLESCLLSVLTFLTSHLHFTTFPLKFAINSDRDGELLLSIFTLSSCQSYIYNNPSLASFFAIMGTTEGF